VAGEFQNQNHIMFPEAEEIVVKLSAQSLDKLADRRLAVMRFRH